MDGNVYQVNQPTGTTTVNTYDPADQFVTSETDGAPVLSATHQQQTTYRYDAVGNQIETVDPAGRDTTTRYDADNRVTQSVDITGTSTITTTSQYDPDGNTLQTTTQTQSGTAPVQTTTDTATYNAADWTVSATDNGLTTSYGYDASGQQRTETIQNGGSTVATTLDPQGRETALAEGGYTASFGYNSNDLPLTATLPGGTPGIQEAFTYDANSRLTGLTANGPTQVPATTTLHNAYGYGYDASGRVNSTTTLSGTDSLSYDAQGRLTQECGPQVVIKGGDGCYHYTYDADGNLRTAADDHVGVTDLYTYTNPLQPDQQTQGGATTSPATATIAFGYDGAGNTTSISDPVALADPSSAPYKKDARNDSFGYDPLGRVVRVTRLESTKVGTDTIVTPFTATISYNAAGLRSDYLLTPDPRTGKQPVDTRFSYRDGELAQAVIVAVTGTLYTNTFVYRADGTPYELIRTDPTGTTRYWYETDGMGSVVALTDQNGKVMDRYGYDSWGEPVTDDRVNEMVPQQLRYRGYYYDEALTYYWTGDGRYYDPEAMRYLQPDAPGGSYVFAGDNPATISDGVQSLADAYKGDAGNLGEAFLASAAEADATHLDKGSVKIRYLAQDKGRSRGADALFSGGAPVYGKSGIPRNILPDFNGFKGVFNKCHVIGRALGGPNNDSLNFFPCFRAVNFPHMYKYENIVRQDLSSGDEYDYSVEVNYGPFLHAVGPYSPRILDQLPSSILLTLVDFTRLDESLQGGNTDAIVFSVRILNDPSGTEIPIKSPF